MTAATAAHTPRELPSGRWQGAFRLPNGRLKTKTFDYPHEAEAWAIEAVARTYAAAEAGHALDAEGNAPAAPAPTAPTLAAYAEAWIETKSTMSKSTREGYRWHVDKIAADKVIAGRPVDALTITEVELWRNREVKRGVTPSTINARLKVVRMVLRRAVDDRVADRNPAEKVAPVPTVLDDVKRALSVEEEARLLVECATDADRAAILLGLDAGLRWQEVYALPIAEVEARAISVRWKIERGVDGVVNSTKGRKGRRVPIATDRLADALAGVIAARRAMGAGDDDLVFVNRDGGMVDYANWRHRTWRGLRHRARLGKSGDRVGFHILRHTFATRLGDAGVPPVEIQGLLGHADLDTTSVYLHRAGDARAFDLVRGALNAPEGGRNAA